MAKRIWFTQQAPYHHMPLRMALGYYQAEEVYNYCGNGLTFCRKIYTTRTHPLSGEYVVVEGSRYKAKPVEPEIRFKVIERYQLDIETEMIRSDKIFGDPGWRHTIHLDKDGLNFPELDIGIRGATFEQLRDKLLRLNPKATLDTPFYVSQLEPV